MWIYWWEFWLLFRILELWLFYMFRWSSGSIHVPCISYVNLDSFWCKQDTTTRCPFWKKVRFADVFLRVHSLFIGHFDLEIYLHSTTYIPLPPSHTTHSVVMGTLQCFYPLLSIACVVSQPFWWMHPFCLCSCLSECTRVIAPLYNSLCIYIRISSQGVGGWEPLLLCLENCPPTHPAIFNSLFSAPWMQARAESRNYSNFTWCVRKKVCAFKLI